MILFPRIAFSAPAALALLLALPAAAQNLIQSNTSIQSNLCVGAGCIETETWAEPVQESIVRIDNNRVRIEFVDASNPLTGFPTNDWSIFTNDFTEFGDSYFAVQDDETDNVPFRVFAGAPTNTLVAAANGRIGLGTMLPQDSVHSVAAISPGLRLEQTGSRIVPAQIWTLRGSTDFSLVDGIESTVPFIVKNAAPNNSLVLGSRIRFRRQNSGTPWHHGLLSWRPGTSLIEMVGGAPKVCCNILRSNSGH